MRRPSTRKLRLVKTQTRRAVASVKAGTRQLRQVQELAAASGATILRRTSRMNRALQTGEGLNDPEFARMGHEKFAVLFESWRAMGLRLPAMNRFLLQHWNSQMQRQISSASAMAACRSPISAAAIGYRAAASMIGDVASLNLALIRFGQGFAQAASAPALRVATANARRLAPGNGHRPA